MTDTTTLAPTDDLQKRCAEIIGWHRTGVLVGDALRSHAESKWPGEVRSLQMAERATENEAIGLIAKWGAPAPASGEAVSPFGYFRAEPFGWTGCAESDEGAKPLYEAPPAQEALLNPDMPTQELRLHMGDLTTDEVLVARAAIRWANSQQEARVPLTSEQQALQAASVEAKLFDEERQKNAALAAEVERLRADTARYEWRTAVDTTDPTQGNAA